ncbi:hypothetical protein Avbf_13117 [Armadillidium vulgare]|nr:hypothetical protein Avbf_13117 [Armadillidium vulgare]
MNLYHKYVLPSYKFKRTKDGKKWTADEERVKMKKEGEEIYTLVFEQAKTEDSGKYSAVLSNVEGSVTTEGSIIVNNKSKENMSERMSIDENEEDLQQMNMMQEKRQSVDYCSVSINDDSRSSKRTRDVSKMLRDDDLIFKSVDSEVFEADYVNPNDENETVKMRAVLKNEDQIQLHRIQSVSEGDNIVSCGASELPVLQVLDKDTGETYTITASYSYKSEQYPKDTVIKASCGIENEMSDSVSTIIKSKRIIEVEKYGFIDDEFSGGEEEEMNNLIKDLSLPSIMPSEFLEIDEISEALRNENKSTESIYIEENKYMEESKKTNDCLTASKIENNDLHCLH